MVSTGDVVCLECDGINEHKPGCSSRKDQEFTVISAYSRKQALDDGVLVDCAQPPFDELNRQAGFKVHIAMTQKPSTLVYIHLVSPNLRFGPRKSISGGN